MDLETRKSWLEKKLRKRVPDHIWGTLVEHRYVKEGMDETDKENLVSQAEMLIRVYQQGSGGKKPPGRADRTDGISAWLDETDLERRSVFENHVARMAADLPGVEGFRREVLGESFPLSHMDARERFMGDDGDIETPPSLEGRLEEIVEELGRVYFWGRDNAFLFILTGYVPPMQTFGLDVHRYKYPEGPEVSTVTITVEPWLSAKKVGQIYSDVQKQMLGGRDNSQPTARSLTLLNFVSEKRSEGNSWRGCLKLWNAAHPEDHRRDERNFRSRYKEVYKKVLEPGHRAAPSDGWWRAKKWQDDLYGWWTAPEKLRERQERNMKPPA